MKNLTTIETEKKAIKIMKQYFNIYSAYSREDLLSIYNGIKSEDYFFNKDLSKASSKILIAELSNFQKVDYKEYLNA